MKTKLANVISKIKTLYLTNIRWRDANLADPYQHPLTRDKIEQSNSSLNDPFKRLFVNPNVSTLHMKMNQLEKRINEKEDKLLFNDNDDDGDDDDADEDGADNKDRRSTIKQPIAINTLKKDKHQLKSDKKSEIRLVVYISTDKLHKASLAKVDVDKVDLNVDGTSTKVKSPYVIDENDAITSNVNDMEVAGSGDAIPIGESRVSQYALNDSNPKTLFDDNSMTTSNIFVKSKDKDSKHPNSSMPSLDNALDKLEENPLLSKKTNAKDKDNKLQNTDVKMEIAGSDNSNYDSNNKLQMTLNNDFLDSSNPLETTDTLNENKMLKSHQNSKHNIIDDLFESDDAENELENADITNNQNNGNSSDISDKNVQSYLDKIGQNEVELNSKPEAKHYNEIYKLHDSGNTLETAGQFNEHDEIKSKQPPEINVHIDLVGPESSKKDIESSDALTDTNDNKRYNKLISPKLYNDSVELPTSSDELEAGRQNNVKPKSEVKSKLRNDASKQYTTDLSPHSDVKPSQ